MQRLAPEFTPRATEILRDIANDPNEDSRNRIVAIGMLYVVSALLPEAIFDGA